MSSAPQSKKNHPGKKHPKGEKPHPKKKGQQKKKPAQKKQHKRQGGVADKSRRNNGRNSKGFANPSPMGVHTKRDVSLNWQNSEACTVTNIKFAPTYAPGKILFQTPLKVDAYPGSLLEREMVQWEKWKMREWGFSFGTLRSKVEPGAVIVFYEPDPKIIHTDGDALVKYAYAHSTKKKISAFDNGVFTVRPPPQDRVERYCLSKGSDERLTSYGTVYVVYLGGSSVAAEEAIWTLEHHQRIDWFMRDMDPAAGGAGSGAQNEGETTTATVADLYNGMTFSPGGIQPRIEGGKLVLEPANIGTGNNVLVTTITEMINNAGVEIPFGTEHDIEGTVYDVCEAIDNFAPQAIGEMAAQAICGGNVLCKIAVRGITSAASSFGANKVRTYMTTLPGEITTLAHPDLARYQPSALHEMERRNTARHTDKQRKLASTRTAMSCLMYNTISVPQLLNQIVDSNVNQEIASYMSDQELVNTGFKLDNVRAVASSVVGDPNRFLANIEFYLRGAANGDTFVAMIRGNSLSATTGEVFEPHSEGLTSLYKRWWKTDTGGCVYMLAGKVITSNSGISFRVTPNDAWRRWNADGWMDIEMYYSTHYLTLFEHLRRKWPVHANLKTQTLEIDKWATGVAMIRDADAIDITATSYRRLPVALDFLSGTENGGMLLDENSETPSPAISLRNFPQELGGWLHCHYFVTSELQNYTWLPLQTVGDRLEEPVNIVMPVGSAGALILHKCRVARRPGTTGLKWNIDTGGVQPNIISVSNFIFGFVETEEEVDKIQNEFKARCKARAAIGAFHKL